MLLSIFIVYGHQVNRRVIKKSNCARVIQTLSKARPHLSHMTPCLDNVCTVAKLYPE